MNNNKKKKRFLKEVVVHDDKILDILPSSVPHNRVIQSFQSAGSKDTGSGKYILIQFENV